MSEIEREEIITGRLEDKQRMLDKRAISRMVKDQRSGDMDGVARASKSLSISFMLFRLLTMVQGHVRLVDSQRKSLAS